MRTIKVGQAAVEIRSYGCVDCGTTQSDEWFEAGTIGLSLAGVQRDPIQLWRCQNCHRDHHAAASAEAEGMGAVYPIEVEALSV